MLDEERAKVQTAMFRGREIAIFQQDDGLFVCWYGGSRVTSPSKELALEYWTAGRTEPLKFSNGNVYP